VVSIGELLRKGYQFFCCRAQMFFALEEEVFTLEARGKKGTSPKISD
jgi:hypothetical protein